MSVNERPLRVRDPGDLVAAVPYLIGFRPNPDRDLVLIAVTGTTARWGPESTCPRSTATSSHPASWTTGPTSPAPATRSAVPREHRRPAGRCRRSQPPGPVHRAPAGTSRQSRAVRPGRCGRLPPAARLADLGLPPDPHAHAADYPDLPPEVLAIQRYARALGCDYVLFDADPVGDLPTWDW